MLNQHKLPTLLVVADTPSVLFWVKKHLDEKFYVLTAESRKEAIGAMNSRLDFIIVDNNFEECDALELCQEMRKEAKLVPIFLITGKLKKNFRDKARDSGVSDFLSDQLDADELEVRIQEGQKTAGARERTADLSASIRSQQAFSSLKNKVVLNEEGFHLLKEVKKGKLPVAFLFIQIDEFEKWETKEEISQILQRFIENLLREKDVLISLSDGHFILLLFNTIADMGKKVAGRLKDKIGIHPFSAIRHLTVSIAVSEKEVSEKSFQKMMDEAVRALSKHSETNLLISFGEESS
jgi:PleD family two-component response regulator